MRNINEIINGDIHTANQRAAGLKSRDEAKTFIYALIYGAGDEKLEASLEETSRQVENCENAFLVVAQHLNILRTELIELRGKILKGLDGRRILIRHQHAALNSLLQGGGAIAMKKAMILLQGL